MFWLFVVFLFVHCVQGGLVSEPLHIEWFSNSVFPGQTILIHAHPVQNRNCSVTFLCTNNELPCSRSPLDSEGIQVGNNSIKAILPQALDVDVFDIHVSCTSDTHESAGDLVANLPEPWWIQGDEGDSATIGGWLRVFGNSLSVLGTRNIAKMKPIDQTTNTKHVIQTQAQSIMQKSAELSAKETINMLLDHGEYDKAVIMLERLKAAKHGQTNDHTTTTLRACKWWGRGKKPETVCEIPIFELISNSSIEDATRSAWFNIPSDLTKKAIDTDLGFWVSNGLGRESNKWVPVSSFISPEFPFGYPVVIKSMSSYHRNPVQLNIKNFGPCAGTRSCNSTIAFHEALAELTKLGGGELYLPSGQYYLSGIDAGALVIPANTTLVGESRQTVAIYFEEKSREESPNTHIGFADCDQAGSYVIQDISFFVSSYYHAILNWPALCSRGLRVERCAFHANAYLGMGAIPQVSPQRGRTAKFHIMDLGPFALIHGKNFEFTDNYIKSTWNTFWSNSPGNSFGLIRGNEILTGGAMHWFDQVKQIIFEHNHHLGVADLSYGSNIDTYAPNGFAQNIYLGHNSMRHVTGNDREGFTLDNNFAYVRASVATSIEGNKLTVPGWTSGSAEHLAGGAVYIMSGPGAGSYRRIIGGEKDSRTILLDEPFVISPIANVSILNVAPFRGRILLDSFEYTDIGAVQLYGYGMDVIVSNLVMKQGYGLFSWGRNGEGGNPFSPNFRIQFINNTIVEGNYAQIGPLPRNETDQGFMVNTYALIGVISFIPGKYALPLNRFVVLRGNRVLNNAAIVVQGCSADVVVEQSEIGNSCTAPVVSTVNKEFRHSILIRNNTCNGQPCQRDMYLNHSTENKQD